MSQLHFDSLRHIDVIRKIFSVVIQVINQQLYTGQLLPKISARQAMTFEKLLTKVSESLDGKALRTIDFTLLSPAAQKSIAHLYTNQPAITPDTLREHYHHHQQQQQPLTSLNYTIAPINQELVEDLLRLRQESSEKQRLLDEKLALVQQLINENFDLQLQEQLLHLQICEQATPEETTLNQQSGQHHDGNQTKHQQPPQQQQDTFGLFNQNIGDYYNFQANQAEVKQSVYQNESKNSNSSQQQPTTSTPATKLYFGLKRKKARVFHSSKLLTQNGLGNGLNLNIGSRNVKANNPKGKIADQERVASLRFKVVSTRRKLFFLVFKTGFVTNKVQSNNTALGNIAKTLGHFWSIGLTTGPQDQ